ncbi:MAG TPA: HlyC/CorC family transporter [Bacteroidetes bacterium]|nr:HlyC/CorC family transporter [Bacteroidota bacterium]
MALLIGFFLLSIVFSFLCSIWEAVLLSVTPSYVKRKETDDPKTGKMLVALKKDIDKPLSAILTLNTIAHTVGAIGVGAQAGKVYGTDVLHVLGLEIAYESIIATLMTLGILFLSEIIPKTIGANRWESLAPMTARSLRVLTFILKPFVWLSSKLTRTLKKDKQKSVFSRQDFAAMADIGSESGEIDAGDVRLIKNVLRFDDLVAKDVMTPRTVMVMAEENQTLRAYFESSKPLIFSRIPLYRENRDKVTGVLLKDDLLQGIIEGKGEKLLVDVKRKIPIVKDNMLLRDVFAYLNGKREHLGVVVDQYGGLIGLLTLEDVIETLFGLEIMDETDSVSDLQAFARQKWEARARDLGLIDEENDN